WVAHDVSAPQLARLDRQPAEPFQTMAGHPVRTARNLAGYETEERANRPHHGRLNGMPVSGDPQLLARRPHPDQHDVWLGGIDLVNQSGMQIKAVGAAANPETGKPDTQQS